MTTTEAIQSIESMRDGFVSQTTAACISHYQCVKNVTQEFAAILNDLRRCKLDEQALSETVCEAWQMYIEVAEQLL